VVRDHQEATSVHGRSTRPGWRSCSPSTTPTGWPAPDST
jgi:hypothetical protein